MKRTIPVLILIYLFLTITAGCVGRSSRKDFVAEGDNLMKSHNYQGAIVAYDKGLSKTRTGNLDDRHELLVKRGKAKEKSGDISGAKQDYSEANQLSQKMSKEKEDKELIKQNIEAYFGPGGPGPFSISTFVNSAYDGGITIKKENGTFFIDSKGNVKKIK